MCTYVCRLPKKIQIECKFVELAFVITYIIFIFFFFAFRVVSCNSGKYQTIYTVNDSLYGSRISVIYFPCLFGKFALRMKSAIFHPTLFRFPPPFHPTLFRGSRGGKLLKRIFTFERANGVRDCPESRRKSWFGFLTTLKNNNVVTGLDVNSTKSPNVSVMVKAVLILALSLSSPTASRRHGRPLPLS